MFERLKSLFGRKKNLAAIDSPLARYAGDKAVTSRGATPQTRSMPPPPPPARVPEAEPEPVAAEAESEPKARVKVILDDGTLAPLPDDPDIREQMERLANQILPAPRER